MKTDCYAVHARRISTHEHKKWSYCSSAGEVVQKVCYREVSPSPVMKWVSVQCLGHLNLRGMGGRKNTL